MKRPETRTEAMGILESAQAQSVLKSIIVPTVVETTHRGERHWSIFDRLLQDRIVFLGDEINDIVANIVIAQLLFLESNEPDKEIMLYINSPGGVVYSGLAIFDTMQHLRSPVATMCVGMAASMAAVLLAAGHKGRRLALSNARIMIHQPHGGARGQVTDIEIQAREVRHLKDTLADILANACGKARDQLTKDMDRDNYMSAASAKEYGLVDEILVPRKKGSDKAA
jgi:ATP-dependent Clp protease, protease subunit